jgi:hypothetical protein
MGNRKTREFMLQQADEADWKRVRTEVRPVTCDVSARGIGIRRLQLIVRPSFDEPRVWEVREGQEWSLHHPRVIESAPELRVVGYDAVPFPSAQLASYFERLSALTLPLRPDQSRTAGCDGTGYELAIFGDLWSGWRFQWWTTWPAQWEPLVSIATEMLDAFTAAQEDRR